MIEKIAQIFETYAPLKDSVAGWDNVGVLIKRDNTCRKILITVDLTMDVVEECTRKQIQNVISYHPVIFKPLKCISDDERVVAECISRNIAVFSPHTALDHKMNEHLLGLICGEDAKDVPKADLDVGKYIAAGSNKKSIGDVISIAKKLAGLERVRVSMGIGHTAESVPEHIQVGVGAAFNHVVGSNAVVVTGEMHHHDLLYNARANITVVLLEHSNSERIFFRENKAAFDKLFSDFEVTLSEVDKDPVTIM